MLQTQHLLSSTFPFSLSHPQTSPPTSPSLNFHYKPTISLLSLSSHKVRTQPVPSWVAAAQPESSTTTTAPPEEGPIELPSSMTSIFATSDNPSPLQVATSVLLTGSICIFLFRSLRRRAKRAKELKFRSSGANKTLKEEAIENLKSMTPTTVEAKGPPSPVQALLGALSAGVIALILYKFTTTIEASLNRQTLSDNLSVRQITITIRTIINGLCYLATFVFGINSIGLFLYSGQLAINSMGVSTSEEMENKDGMLSSSLYPTDKDSSEENSTSEDQSSDKIQ
ncbi:unnamed protein product [Ilex paraguariensis]|uniref:Transmembrane protein n=1 Tax=Ilex paraguariensis TaxID=185542 RepID=A0ABC8UPI4_9AQUA